MAYEVAAWQVLLWILHELQYGANEQQHVPDAVEGMLLRAASPANGYSCNVADGKCGRPKHELSVGHMLQR